MSKQAKKCPLCKNMYMGYPALSRTDNLTDICPDCGTLQAIASILPFEQCDVCEKTGVRFIHVQVSNDGQVYSWLDVCSEECLIKVMQHWKQIAEIFRPSI